MKKVIVSFSIDQDLKEFLDSYAKEKRVPRSTVITLLLVKLMKGEGEVL